MSGKELLQLLSDYSGRKYESSSQLDSLLKDYPAHLVARVIKAKGEEWKDNEEMVKYLRPTTLFGKNNFKKYLDDIYTEEKPREAVWTEDAKRATLSRHQPPATSQD